MILLSAGTGRVARAVARELATLPGSKRFLPSKSSRNGALPGFELAAGGLTAAARARALEGASELVLLPTLDPRAAEEQAALIRDAAAAGVQQIRMVSLVGADARSPVCVLRWVGLMEREVHDSALAYTVLRCAPFMQNVKLFARRDESGLALIGPFRDAAFPWLDAADVGAILARLIRNGGNENLSCQLSGPQSIDLETVARLLSDVLHEPVRYIDVCLPEAQGILEGNGITPLQIRAITEYWDYLVSGVIKPSCCDTALQLLGRPPRTLAQYLADYGEELRAAA